MKPNGIFKLCGCDRSIEKENCKLARTGWGQNFIGIIFANLPGFILFAAFCNFAGLEPTMLVLG